MLVKQTRSTLIIDFTTSNQDDELFTPETVAISIVKPNGKEDAIHYLGAEPGDSRLTLVSTGTFTCYYPILDADPPGIWFINVEWSTTFLGETIQCSISEPVPFRVTASISKGIDS